MRSWKASARALRVLAEKNPSSEAAEMAQSAVFMLLEMKRGGWRDGQLRLTAKGAVIACRLAVGQ